MKLSRSKSMFNIFTLFTLLAMLFGMVPASPVQAETLASPLFASGDFVWAKGMGGLSDDFGSGIAIDSSGNVYTTGRFQGTVDFDPGAGTFNLTSVGFYDTFISKVDSSGNFIWAKNFGGSGIDTHIAVDSSDNTYTTGTFGGTVDFDPGAGTSNLTSAGSYDIFISKLDSNGNFVWAKSMGGTSYDFSNDIAIDSNSDIYTTGRFTDTADFDPGAGASNLTSAGLNDIFVSKLDSSGNFIWAKSMGGTNSDQGNSIALDSNSNVYITGSFQGTADFDPGVGTANLTGGGGFISKLDSNGDFVWAKNMGNSGDAITVASNGNVYTMGRFVGTVDFDPGTGIFNLTSAGNDDIFVSKLDSNGDFVWAKNMGGTNYDWGKGIAIDSSGNVYMTGEFWGTADFDPGVGTVNLTSAGSVDIFVSKLDANGTFVWAKSMGGAYYYFDSFSDSGFDIALDSSGNIYTTGTFAGTADFDPGPGIFNLTSNSEAADIFISKLQAGKILYATPSGTGDCSSWANACSLQTALTNAVSSDQIWVAAGAYYPGTTDRASTFTLKNGVAVYGGFNATETQLSQRDIAANPTILSGDIDLNDTNIDGNFIAETTTDIQGSNAYHVVSGGGTDNTALLDGFIVTAGQANDLTLNYSGGGMINENSNPTLINLTFSGNSAYSGGGIYTANSNSTLTNVTFSGNSANSGGGGMYNYNGNPTLTNVTFNNNNAQGGGGMVNYTSSPSLTNVTFNSNIVTENGGGMYNYSSNPTLTGVVFSSNSASYEGGGMYNLTNSNPTLTDVTFNNNSVGYKGGGMANGTSNPTLSNVTFSGNSAGYYQGTYPFADGGGMNNYRSNPTLTNVTFSGNSATESGGGIYNDGASTLTNVTFSGNSATSGGGLYNIFDGLTLTNTLIANSTSGGDCVNGAGSLSAASSHNLIEDSANACGLTNGTNGNIIGQDPNLGPLQDNGGFTQTHALLTGSPAIDMGDDAACPLTDQRGITRPQGLHCDIGAFELVDTTAPDTTIDSKPASLDNDSTPTFTFSGNDGTGSGIASFLCRMDGGAYATCASPFTSPALTDGSHTFDVYAIDLLGNADASPASHTWTLEAISPIVTSITRVNPSPTNLTSVGFIVTFSKPVTGVDKVGPAFDDFTLATSSGISGASVTTVSGSGTTYTVTVNTGSGNGTLRLNVGTGGNIVDAALNPLAGGFTTGEVYSVIKMATFADMPLDYWANSFIERLYNAGITGGCSTTPLMYCPDTVVTRAQMAVFLLRGEHGSTYSPPAVGASTDFTDVPLDYWAAAWIKQLALEGITFGCGPGVYCPEASVTRDQMAVFLLRAKYGSAYSPPPATGVFTDVPADYWAAAWIEQLAAEGITAGCGTGSYCPNVAVTRAQMAVFLVRTFSLP